MYVIQNRLFGRYSALARRYLSAPRVSLQDNIHQRMANRRRFYKEVQVEPVLSEDPAAPPHYKITLDGRNLRTPARNDLHLPSLELAMGIALEWDAQVHVRTGIQPATMPLMILASTAIDTIRQDPETVINTCMGYLPTDSALFWTSEEDRVLLKKQKMTYEPLIRWARRDLNVSLPTSQTMTGKLTIPEETVKYVRSLVEKMDEFELACLQCAVMDSKSLLIGLALMFRKLDLSHACRASRVEEDFQTEIWGIVEGGHDMDILNNRIALSSVDVFLTSYWGGEDDENSMANRLQHIIKSV